VVDKHGGEIDFESEVGKGTTFIIRLPLNVEDEGESGEEVEGANDAGGRKEKIEA